jgi:hypothetical protein
MIALILKFIPAKDLVYLALITVLLVGGYAAWKHHDTVERDIGQQQVVAAVKIASKKAEDAAAAEIAKTSAEHANDLAKVESNYENLIKSDDAASAADITRLRKLASDNQHANPVLGGAGSGAAPAATGESSLIGLGNVSAELAAALRGARDDLTKCYADRDALTGK